MTTPPSTDPPRGPVLLCAGTDAAAAARLAEAAAVLLNHRPAVVLATWQPAPSLSGIDAAMDALYSIHADLRDAARRAAAQTANAAVIVTGSRGRSRIAAALLGSTAENVVRHAGRPVLLVPTPAGAEA